MKHIQKKIIICLIGDLSSIHNHKYIDYLKSQGYEIHFLATHLGEVTGIKIYDLSRHRFEPMFFWFLRLIWRSRQLIRQIKPHIVHGRYLIPGGILVYLSGFRPYVVDAWGSDILETPRFLKPLVKKTLAQAEVVLGTSEQLVKACIDQGSVKSKTHLIRLGVDLNIFKPFKVDELRRELKLENKKVILSPRAIDHIYNNKMIVEAFNLIPNKDNLVLVMIDQPFNPEYAYEVRNRIKQLGLEDKVVFLPAIENKKMADYYNLADVMVSFASSDGFSICILESLACEKKVVMSVLPNLDEAWVKNLGFWKSKIEAKALSETIIEALKFPDEKFVPVGKMNRQLVKENANLNNCFDRIPEYYNKILE